MMSYDPFAIDRRLYPGRYIARGRHAEGRGIVTNHGEACGPLYHGDDLNEAIAACKAYLGMSSCPRRASVHEIPPLTRAEEMPQQFAPVVWGGCNF